VKRPPTLVSAGAGSGKTHWIVEHLTARVLEGVPIDRIAAVTFTEAAAAELKARLRARLLRAGAREQAARIDAAAVCTIHRFSLELLRRYPTAVGLAPDPLVLDARATSRLFRRALTSAVSRTSPDALDGLLDLLGPALGGIERGRDDQDTPAGRLRRLVFAVLEKARSIAMDADRLRVEADLCVGRLLGALGTPERGAQTLDEALRDAIREAFAFVDARPIPPTKTDEDLYAKLRSIDREAFARSLSVRADAAVSLSSAKSVEPSKKFAAGATLVGAAQAFCADHPMIRERLAALLRGVFGCAADTLAAFDREKRRLGALDFDDMQTLALALLEGTAPAARSYAPLVASTLELIVVDEFQDSAPLQFRLFEILREHGVELAYVGDLKQAIYGFRAADSALFGALLSAREQSATPDAILRLGASRRSRPELVSFANDLFAALFARTRMPFDPLTADNVYTRERIEKSEPSLEVVRYGATERGALVGARGRVVAGRIRTLVDSTRVLDAQTGALRPARFSDVTLLARTHKDLAEWATRLREGGVPCALAETPWFDTLEARLCVAWLRMVSSPRDSAASASVLVSELYGLSQPSVAALHARGVGGLPARALELHALDPASLPLTTREQQALRRCAKDLADCRRDFRTIPLVEAVERALARVEASLKLSLRADEAGAAQIAANVRGLSEVAQQLAAYDERALSARESRGRTLEALLVELEQLADEGASQPNPELSRDAVSLVTMHACKGLEYPIVVLDALSERFELRLPRVDLSRPDDALLAPDLLTRTGLDLVPTVAPVRLREKLSLVFDAEVQARDEALRLLYVAVTRAREHLLLLWPEEAKTPSATRYFRDLLTDTISRPPSTAGESGWTLSSDGTSHRVLISHASALAASEVDATASAEDPIERYRELVESAARRADSKPLDAMEEPGELDLPVARVLSPTELVHLDDCPEVPRLALLHPHEYRLARSREEPVRVRAIPSAREARLRLSEVPPAQIGVAFHSALAHFGTARAPALDEVLPLLSIAAEDPSREPLARFVVEALASTRAALATLGVRKVVAHELPFLTTVGNTVLRGAVDLVVESDEGLRVIDVKTHPIEPEALARTAAHYRVQLEAYAHAVSTLLHAPVVGIDLLIPSAGALVTCVTRHDGEPFVSKVRRLGVLAATGARGPGVGAECARCAWAPLCRVSEERA
jgi:ATP-dependent helicase/nuclease subunit A